MSKQDPGCRGVHRMHTPERGGRAHARKPKSTGAITHRNMPDILVEENVHALGNASRRVHAHDISEGRHEIEDGALIQVRGLIACAHAEDDGC
eukprot:scaffold211765_cov30-Tisochrysis_lutea.AAC.3